METVNKVNETKKDAKKVDFSNLEKLASSVKLPEGSSSGSKEIYKISELTEKQRRAFRREMRKDLDNYAIDVVTGLNSKNYDKIQKIYDKFMPIYKAKFVLNDFSLASIRTTIKHEADRKNLQIFIDTMKTIHESK